MIVLARPLLVCAVLSTVSTQPGISQDTTSANMIPVSVLLDSAEQFLRQGRNGHAEIFAREALSQRSRTTQDEYLRALLILARGLHPGEAETTVLRDTTRYPLLRTSRNAAPGEAVVLDLISDGTRQLVQRSDSSAQESAWSAFDRVFSREGLASGVWHLSSASPDLQIRGLELLAGVLHPRTIGADTAAAQRADGVRGYLKHIVRLDPSWTLSPLVSWSWPEGQQHVVPSLDDLFAQAYDSTFGMSARRLYQPADEQGDASPFALSIDSIAIGPDGDRVWDSRQSVIAVQSNRPATFSLTAVDQEQNEYPIDAIDQATDRGILNFNLLQTGDPRLPQPRLISARYSLVVTGISSDSTRQRVDTLTRCFDSELIEAPPIPRPLIPSAAALDMPGELSRSEFAAWQTAHPDSHVREWRSRVRLEAERPSRVGTAIRGLGLGLSAALLANGLRSSEVRGSVASDGRAVVIGGAVALSSIVAALTNQPVRNVSNVRHNETVRSVFRDAVRGQWEQYAARIHRVQPTIRIGGPRLCGG